MSDLPQTPSVPVPPTGETWTKTYDCGCSASGGKELPDYCGEHGSAPPARVRAKFVCNSYETALQHGQHGKSPTECRTVKLSAVYDGSEENKRFFRFTPSGSISLGTLNPEAWKVFDLGGEFYVDFIPVPKPVVPTGSIPAKPQFT